FSESIVSTGTSSPRVNAPRARAPKFCTTSGASTGTRSVPGCAPRAACRHTTLVRPFSARLAQRVHSGYCRGHYRRALGVESRVLPCPLAWQRVRCDEVRPRYLTFVNPQPGKGVALFARLALELGRLRPDVPLLVVEGRGGAGWLGRCRL